MERILQPVVLAPFAHTCADQPRFVCDACEWAERWEQAREISREPEEELVSYAGL